MWCSRKLIKNTNVIDDRNLWRWMWGSDMPDGCTQKNQQTDCSSPLSIITLCVCVYVRRLFLCNNSFPSYSIHSVFNRLVIRHSTKSPALSAFTTASTISTNVYKIFDVIIVAGGVARTPYCHCKMFHLIPVAVSFIKCNYTSHSPLFSARDEHSTVYDDVVDAPRLASQTSAMLLIRDDDNDNASLIMTILFVFFISCARCSTSSAPQSSCPLCETRN